MKTKSSFLKLKNGHWVAPKGVKIKHRLASRYYSKYRFKNNPETVCKILEDLPEMREHLNVDFYKYWLKSLRNINNVKTCEKFNFTYDFKLPPYEHQKTALAFLLSLPAAYLGAQTGTGKTFVGAVMTDMRLNKGTIKRALIIAPKVVVKSGWFKDFQKFTHAEDKVIIAHNYLGNIKVPNEKWKDYKTVAEKANAEEFPIVITTPQTFSNYADDFYRADFDQVIVDEATMIGSNSKQAKAIRKMRDYAPFRVAMSATPGNIEKIYNQFEFLDNPFDCSTITEFRSKFMFSPPGHPYINNPIRGSRKKVADTIRDRFLFINKEECLDLPPRVIKNIFIEPSSKIKTKYRSLLKEYFVMINDKELTVQTRLAHMAKLRQVLNGHCLIDGELEIIDPNPPKLKYIKKMVDNLDEPCIIWAWFKQDFVMLEEALKEYNPAIVNGKTKSADDELDKIKDGTSTVLLAHPMSMQFGVSLNEAPHMFFFTYNYGEIAYNQAKARNRRLGNESEQILEYRLSSGGIEDMIWDSIEKQTDFTTEIMDRIEDLEV